MMNDDLHTMSEDTSQQMWDLVYGLLDEEESKVLIARIKSDPQAARLYAKVRLQADLVGEAARVKDSAFLPKVDDAVKSGGVVSKAPPVGSKSRSVAVGSDWLLTVAATALVALLAVGWLWPRPDERAIATRFVAGSVVAPKSLPSGLTAKVEVQTHQLNPSGDFGQAVATIVEVRVVDRDGKER